MIDQNAVRQWEKANRWTLATHPSTSTCQIPIPSLNVTTRETGNVETTGWPIMTEAETEMPFSVGGHLHQ